MEQNELPSTLKKLRGGKYCSQKLTQFPQGNNVLDSPRSNVNGFLLKDSCVSSTQLSRPIWNKMRVSHL
jgi:hypothetical protein